MKDALYFLVTSIVDNAEAVVIDETEEEGIINFVIHVAKEDIGKVIGKEGKVIRALRNVMKIPAMKQQKKIHVSVGEE
jgi:predicted RNA-binding protein YlqC (UPF0109 family)